MIRSPDSDDEESAQVLRSKIRDIQMWTGVNNNVDMQLMI